MDFEIKSAIGGTPLVFISELGIYLKCEWQNPSGSIKDRTALYLLRGGILRGELYRGMRVVEASSGNMGVSLAFMGAALGLGVRIYMPKGATSERIRLMTGYGAEVILTDRALGMAGAVARAESEGGGSFYTRQFENTDGALAHYETTAEEIISALCGVPDAIVMGVGTGGTFTGVVKKMKERGGCLAVAVEPEESPTLSRGDAGSHGIYGIGAGFVPPLLNRSLVDRVETVKTGEAVGTARRIMREHGLPVGISGGAAILASMRIKREIPDARVVAILPDGVDRYLSILK